MKIDTRTTILILAVILVAAGLYWFFFSGNSGSETPLTPSSSQNTAQSQFQTLVGQLQPITFNTSIFNDPRFTALVDLTTPILAEPSGRSDPFGPIYGSR